MNDLRRLRNTSDPPKGGVHVECIWDDHDESAFFRGLVTELGMLIPPTLREEIEIALPGVDTGDIESGRVLLVRNRELPDGFDFGYYVQDDETMRHHKVTVIDSDAVGSLSEAFAILMGWQDQRGGAA